MDEQEKERMRQAVEFTRQRIARERTKENGVSVVAVSPASAVSEGDSERKIVRLPGAYLESLFETRPAYFSKDPDTLFYPCLTCGEIPGVFRRSNGYRRCPCQCVQEEYERQDLLRFQESVRQDRLSIPARDRATYTWLGLDYSSLAERSLANFEMQHQREAFMLVTGYVKRILTRSANQDNVLLYGESAGLGKTHLATSLLNCCYENGYSCLFCTAKDYFDALWAADFSQRLALRQRASKADYMLIDDIDKAEQKDTTAQKNEFFQLLNVRYEAGRPTFFTANSADLSRWFNEWTVSRIQERLLRIPVSGKDYRELRSARARQGLNVG